MRQLVSVVVPACDEEGVIREFHGRLAHVLSTLDHFRWEVLFVDDGSRDKTHSLLHELRESDSRVGIVQLSRNFGKEIAMTAGLDHARGDAVVVIDADLQDPPELIADFLREWQSGFDVVYARRTHRDGESWLKKRTADFFYRTIGRLSKVEVPANTGDYRLLSRRAVDALLQLREHHRFMKGLFAWVGYPSKAVPYRRERRAAGASKFSYWKLWNFALEGITSFSMLPLKLATYLGIFIAFMAFVSGAWIIARTLIWSHDVAGYPSLIVTVLFLGGVQLFFIGIIGEYVGRIYNEVKKRPLYVVQSFKPPGDNAAT
ncbi:MAG: glycosyltransferase family 2 protein [Variovorax sp.]